MKRLSFTGFVIRSFLIFATSLCFAQNSGYTRLVPKAEPGTNSYTMIINGYDWGAACDSAVLNVGKTVKKSDVRAEDFSVDVVYKTDSGYGMVRGSRVVTEAFVSDSYGTKEKSKGEYITLRFLIGPEVENSNPYVGLAASFVVNDVYSLRIKNDALKINASSCTACVSPVAGLFSISESSYNEVNLKYASYIPESAIAEKGLLSKLGLKNKKVPLIIWFHGIAESGQNPYKPLLGTKTTNLVSPEIQKYFADGACVLVPQCPTAWLETTTVDALGMRVWEVADIQGTVEKITKPVTDFLSKIFVIPDSSGTSRIQSNTDNASVSYYNTAVKKIIDDFIEENSFIDTNRIYVGGCSAGGFMTLNMVINYPDFFAAAFTASEAFLDRKITEESLAVLARTPLWFVYAENDGVIKPQNNCIPTIERLKAIEAKNLHVSAYKNVVDTSGLYFKENGEPYEYNGHDSWIYMLNNECVSDGKTIFEWLSRQSR